MRKADRLKFVVGLVLVLGGLNLTLLLSHLSWLVGVLLLALGIGLVIWAMREEKPRIEVPEKKKENMAAALVRVLTLEGRLTFLLPVAGAAVIAAVILYNLIVPEEFYLGSNDYVTIVLGCTMLAYDFVPRNYSVERDFAFLFSVLLFLLLVIPTTLLSLTGSGGDTNSPLTYYLLSYPTMVLVGLFGIDVSAPQYNVMSIIGSDGSNMLLNIGLSCTGLYSVAIFVSGFVAFVAVEYRKLDEKVVALLCLGILLAWVANVLRMTIIVLVGYHYGMDTMQWTHNNIGEFIFMLWVIVFWLVMFKYFGFWDRGEEGPRRKRTVKTCAVCGEALGPSAPSKRCGCGAISHIDCLRNSGGQCPVCGARAEPVDSKT